MTRRARLDSAPPKADCGYAAANKKPAEAGSLLLSSAATMFAHGDAHGGASPADELLP